MERRKYAKLFTNGKSQAVRLPKEFRFEGDQVEISRFGVGVLLYPMKFDVNAYFKAIDDCSASDFMPDGREQPVYRTTRRPLTKTYSLDTNTCIDIIRKAPNQVRLHLKEAFENSAYIVVPTSVLHELWFGVAKSANTHHEHALKNF